MVLMLNLRQNVFDPSKKLDRLHESRMKCGADINLYQSCFVVVVADLFSDANWDKVLARVEALVEKSRK